MCSQPLYPVQPALVPSAASPCTQAWSHPMKNTLHISTLLPLPHHPSGQSQARMAISSLSVVCPELVGVMYLLGLHSMHVKQCFLFHAEGRCHICIHIPSLESAASHHRLGVRQHQGVFELNRRSWCCSCWTCREQVLVVLHEQLHCHV